MGSTGVLVGLLGLAAFLAGLIWLAINNFKNKPLKRPAVLIVVSLIICFTGYFLTPTGMANIKLILGNLN